MSCFVIGVGVEGGGVSGRVLRALRDWRLNWVKWGMGYGFVGGIWCES